MNLHPSKIRFLLVNGLLESDVKNADFFVYAHVCNDGMYVGMTNDPVKRWQQHFKEGLKISCSKKELDKFEFGSKVRIKVSEISREGTTFLKAANTALIEQVNE